MIEILSLLIIGSIHFSDRATFDFSGTTIKTESVVESIEEDYINFADVEKDIGLTSEFYASMDPVTERENFIDEINKQTESHCPDVFEFGIGRTVEREVDPKYLEGEEVQVYMLHQDGEFLVNHLLFKK